MAALRFDRVAGCPGLPDDHQAWNAALDFCDRSQLTLAFGVALDALLPGWVRKRIAGNLADNARRLDAIRALQSQVDQWLSAAGIEHLFLKGTTQWPHFLADPRVRMQYDLDVYCPAGDVRRAWDLLIAKGYEPLEEPGVHPTDHLPTLIRKTGWNWRGDYFDREIPLSIELHFQFWDEDTERLRAPGVEQFWERRVGQALDTPDALGYAALHLLRHLLRGSLSPYHAYELAWFLEHHARDTEFWRRWQSLHTPELRRLQGISFFLAREWFGCAVAPVADAETAGLPVAVNDWFEAFAVSPLEGLFHPNKDELWLHLSLLDSARDKLAVTRRRLLPMQLPGPIDAVCIPEEQLTLGMRVRSRARYLGFLAGRVVHHVRTVPALVRSGLRWRMRRGGLSRGYWMFLGASSFFNVGMFVYALLYNLYLIDLGFREDFVGQVSSATTAGCVLGAMPAALFARRYGLGKLLLASFAAVGGISVLRALVTGRAPLLGLSFVNGLIFAGIAVSLAPAIARLTSEEARATGFSVSTASSIALGILGGWLGGGLPGWLGGKRPALLAGCAITFLALWPASRLRIGPAPSEGSKIYPRSRFVVGFLAAFAIWNLATGSFNPFFNTYFARLRTPVERIGLIFSASQLAQVAALLAAPWVLKRLGIVSGTAVMMLATAVALGGLAAGPAGLGAAALYAVYAAFQWMSDPGMNTLLMGRVREAERGGAAALMMMVSFGAQFVASFAGGSSIARFGYPAVLACAAALAAIGAFAFRALPEKERAPAATSEPSHGDSESSTVRPATTA